MNWLKHGTKDASAIFSIARVAAASVGKMYTHCVKANSGELPKILPDVTASRLGLSKA